MNFSDADKSWLIKECCFDNSEEVEINEFATLITDKVSEMQFEGEGYVVRLVGNFTTDLYKIVIKEEI